MVELRAPTRATAGTPGSSRTAQSLSGRGKRGSVDRRRYFAQRNPVGSAGGESGLDGSPSGGSDAL